MKKNQADIGIISAQIMLVYSIISYCTKIDIFHYSAKLHKLKKYNSNVYFFAYCVANASSLIILGCISSSLFI